MDKNLVLFEDANVGILSIWAIGHGLVSLEVRCRLKVLDIKEEDVPALLDRAINDYLGMIKR